MAELPYIVGNWKMNGSRAMLGELRAIDRAASRMPEVQVGIAPPATLIAPACDTVELIAIGGQDCHSRDSGAFTGDIAAAMLRDVGAAFTIVGHSERRTLHGDTNMAVKDKADAAQAAGLSVILCVGETQAQRDAGDALAVVEEQLAQSCPRTARAAARLAVAYEPVWAIGSGRIPSIEEIAAMHASIRKALIAIYGDAGADIRILYGGSVNSANASELLAIPEVGGALVGGASLTAESFLAIMSAATSTTGR